MTSSHFFIHHLVSLFFPNTFPLVLTSTQSGRRWTLQLTQVGEMCVLCVLIFQMSWTSSQSFPVPPGDSSTPPGVQVLLVGNHWFSALFIQNKQAECLRSNWKHSTQSHSAYLEEQFECNSCGCHVSLDCYVYLIPRNEWWLSAVSHTNPQCVTF